MTKTGETLKSPERRSTQRRHSLTFLELSATLDRYPTVRKDRDASKRHTVDKDPLSGSLNGHYLRLEYATIVQQSEENVQVQFLRIDSATNNIIEFREDGVYIKEFKGKDRIRIPVFPTRNQRT